MQSIKHKFIAALVVMTLLAGSLAVVAPSHPARALGPSVTVIDIPRIIAQGVLKAVESALYVVLRKYVQRGVENITKTWINDTFKGGRGKGPAFETRPWDDYWEEAGNEAVGAAVEGLVQGMANEYEAQKKEGEVYKSLEQTVEKGKQISLEGGDLNYKLKTCNAESIGLADPNDITKKIAECDGIADQVQAKAKEQEKFYEDNKGRFRAYGVRDTYSTKLSALNKDLEKAREDEKTCRSNPPVAGCQGKRDDVLLKLDEIDAHNKKADKDFAEADPESSTAIKTIRNEHQKKDSDLVRGQTGALSEVGRTIVDIVCKPEADFALKIFLGLGDDISLTKRKPICPLDVLKKNWSRVITNAGFEPGGLLSEQTIDAWQNLAALVNPETSDLGVSLKVSVAGHDVKDIAHQLGITDYTTIAAAGGFLPVKDLAKTTITTPVKNVTAVVDQVIDTNFGAGSELKTVGHIVADLVITAGATFLQTTLDIVKDGLRKRIVRRQPKTPSGISALSKYARNRSLYFPDADPDAGTEAFAEATLAAFDELKYTGEQSWDVLSKITATGNNTLCYNPGTTANVSVEQKAADPESCAIDEDFARAIREGMTVQQAIDAKLLDPNGIFGFNFLSNIDDDQPQVSNTTKQYPYNSLVILRKYRVIPVSWELAALYIKEKSREKSDKEALFTVCNEKNCTLGLLKEHFNNPISPFYQMVDPNWLLKIPPTKCMLEGYGPQVIQELEVQVPDDTDIENKNKTKPEIQIVRGKACVDYQTCLGENEKGECVRGYGYCLKEETIAHFVGTQCNEIYSTCQSFTDTETKQPLTVLTSSLADNKKGICTQENAGCQWYSKTQQVKTGSTDPSKRVMLAPDNRKKVFAEDGVRKDWLDTDKVYFASSAKKCEPKAEGCRQVDGPAGTPQYLRLPPASLNCGVNGVKADGTEVQWYKREECKAYTQLCKQEYVGCEQYLPENDSIAVTGKSPDDSADSDPVKRYQYRCPAACANIYNYAEQKTLFEPLSDPDDPDDTEVKVARYVYFNAATAQKCSVADVGCEEFTNLDEEKRGGEKKDYFTYLQHCVKEDNPENIPANEVFYHFVGSDTAGGQPEKHYVVGELVDHDKDSATPTELAPKRADPAKPSDCSADTAEKSLYDPRIGSVPCREFINANGKPFYRYTDNLIYRTPDCTSYRRTIENQAGVASTYSPGLSRRCSSAALNCREYRAPQAGNVRVVSYDNFEDEKVGKWTGTGLVRISNDGEILGDHSTKITPIGTSVLSIKKADILFLKNKAYKISFNLKSSYEGAKVSVDTDMLIRGLGEHSEGTGTSWKRFQFNAQIGTEDRKGITITVYKSDTDTNTESIKDVIIDDIIVKEVEGIEYVIRDSWVENRESRCFNPKDRNANPPDLTPNFDNPAYSGCSLYTDRQGSQQAIRSFQRICPNEMAGCVQATIPQGDTVNSSGKVTGLKDRTEYLIPDNAKACRATDNKCTAYGSPKLLIKADGGEQLKTSENTATDESRNEWKFKEDWNIAYLKITPEEAQVAQTKFNDNDVSPYESGICRAPTTTDSKGDLGCRAYTQTGGGETYFRDPGKRLCQPPESEGANWFYNTCNRTTSIVCKTNSDCPITNGVQENCNTAIKNPCGTIATSAFALTCPIDMVGCRKIKDPNCIEVAESGKCLNEARGPTACTAENADTVCKHGSKCAFDYRLKDNYGRTDVADSGISCKPEYYFTEDFDAKTKKCDGQVNPGAGCILVNDEKLQRYEYDIVKGNYCAITITQSCDSANNNCPVVLNTTTEEACKTNVNAAIKDTGAADLQTYCICDSNPQLESDCDEKEEASSLSPEVCYNRFSDNKGSYLRKYERKQTDLQYSSDALYLAARGNTSNPGSTNLTASAVATKKDSNTLVKIRPDRQCKVWLECTAYEKSGNDIICKERKPCSRSVTQDGTCNFVKYSSAPYLNRLLEDGTRDTDTDTVKKAARKELLTISGYARPDYKFSDGVKTRGGYSANFGDWLTEMLPTAADNVGGVRNISQNLVYASLVPITRDDGSKQKVCSNDWIKSCSKAEDCPPVSGQNGTCIDHPGYLNACRLYPKQDTKGFAQKNEIVDACQATNTSSGGIYGYCLQPNPLFERDYNIRPMLPNNGYCKTRPGIQCKTNNDCTFKEISDECVYRYYENYCLNWFPIDQTGYQTLFSDKDSNTYMPKIPENLFYCLKETGLVSAPLFEPPVKIGVLPEEKITILGKGDELITRGQDTYDTFKLCSNISVAFSPNPGSGNESLDKQCKREYNFNMWSGKNNDHFFLRQVDMTAKGGNIESILLNDKEKGKKIGNNLYPFKRGDIESINYSYSIFYDTRYGGDESSIWSNDNLGVTIMYPGGNDLNYYSAFDGGCQNNDQEGKAFFSIRPKFNSKDELDGWETATCNNSRETWRLNENWAIAVIGGITLNFREREEITSFEEDVKISYKHKYCSEIIRVVSDQNEAVMDQSFKDDYNTDAIQIKNVSAINQIVLNRVGVCYTPKDSKRRYLESDCDGEGLCKYIKDKKCIEAEMSGPDDNPEWDVIKDKYKPQKQKIVLGNINNLRSRTRFRKIYEHYRWDDAKREYQKIVHSSNLDNYWSDTQCLDIKNGPRVYNDKLEKDRFNVARGTMSNDIKVSFWVNVNDGHIPLNGWNIILPHYGIGKDKLPEKFKKTARDGQGWMDNFHDDQKVTASGRSGIQFGPAYQYYDGASYDLKNQPVCVEVVDNWKVCTRTCVNLDSTGKKIDDRTWTLTDCPSSEFCPLSK
ncbi:hypothetical protein HY623_00620 [Candidatus Uhrbacteria bacterium]|nr:hypothetical protein [Candidatus Uhrbacteria bacterium]